ncbi:MAG TPA: amino acid ABC transporter permease [Microvirga sp.]|jgi:polar amino acid transport system permease protein
MRYTFQFSGVWDRLDLLFAGAWATIQLSALSMLIGLGVGVVCARVLTHGPKPLRLVVRAYVETIRNTPLLVQLFLIFFGLPSLGVRLTADAAALITLSVNLGAYSTEIVRAGLDAVHRSQIEAGEALAMTPFQVFRYVVLPPALEKVYPALASQFVLTMLASSIVSAISAEELTSAANLIQSQTFRSFEVYIVVGIAYLLLAFLFRGLFLLLGLAAFPRRRRDFLAGTRA